MKKGIVWAALALLVASGLYGCGGGGGGGSSDPAGSTTTYSISGSVTASSAGLQGITITLSGASSATVTTDASGNFSFPSLANGSYTVTPSKTGYTFNPTSSAQTVNGTNITGVAFTATANTAPTYNISGAVTSSGSGTQGITMTLSGAGSATATTDSSGGYAFTGLVNGNYTVTPSKAGYRFSPASSSQTVSSSNITGVAFTAYTGFRMPDTGQTTKYTTTFGEDADYAINPPSYADNGNGTVMDNITGLVWQKQDDGLSKIWADAGTYCNNLTLGGQSGWRLPNRIELSTLINNGTITPAIDTTFFPNTVYSAISPTAQTGYWTSVTNANYSTEAWTVNFAYGVPVNEEPKTNTDYVRCVRGGQPLTPSLIDNGNGTVTDGTTHLTWQQGESSLMTWEAALTYCEGLTLAGANDWRLPNHKELSSLQDDTRYNPAINTTMFPNIHTSNDTVFYWSSTTFVFDTTNAIAVNFDYGSHFWPRLKTDSGYVRCIRGGQ